MLSVMLKYFRSYVSNISSSAEWLRLELKCLFLALFLVHFCCTQLGAVESLSQILWARPSHDIYIKCSVGFLNLLTEKFQHESGKELKPSVNETKIHLTIYFQNVAECWMGLQDHFRLLDILHSLTLTTWIVYGLWVFPLMALL